MREVIVTSAIVSSLNQMQLWFVDTMRGRTTHMVFAIAVGAKNTEKKHNKKTDSRILTTRLLSLPKDSHVVIEIYFGYKQKKCPIIKVQQIKNTFITFKKWYYVDI